MIETRSQSEAGTEESRRPTRPAGVPWWRRISVPDGLPRSLGETVLVLAALDVLSCLQAAWPARVGALAILIIFPGFLVLRAAGMSLHDMAKSAGWVPVASLVTLTVVALATDLLGQRLGTSEPLRAGPLLLSVNLALVLLSLLPGKSTPFGALSTLAGRTDLRSATTLGVPLLAAVGALRLNSGHGSTVAIAAAGAVMVLVAAAIWFARTWSTQRLSWILYSSATALLLSFSLRSSYVFGWDISAEYGLLHKTLADGVWQPLHPGDAYGAMLSLTVLPALLHALTGLSALVLLKLVYPVLFGLFVVMTFGLLRLALPTRGALIGAVLLLAQGQFLSEMPALARQELALLAYLALLGAIFDRTLKWPPRILLLVLLSFGVTVFHYSTNYTLISLLAMAVFVELVVALWHRSRPVDPRKVLALGLTVTFGFIWYVGVTHSTSNAAGAATALKEAGLQILPNAGSGQNPIEAYLKGNLVKALTVPQYQTQIARDYAQLRPWVVRAPDAADPKWALTATPALPEAAASFSLASLVNLAQLLVSQLINVLAVLGTLILLLRRRIPAVLLDFAILSLPAVMLLAVVRMSGTLAAFYGQDRLLIQLLPIVAAPVLWVLIETKQLSERLARRAGERPGRLFQRILGPLAVTAFSLAVLFQMSQATGLLPTAMGQRAASNLFNNGENYERFYVTGPEVAAAEWLAQVQPKGTIAYTDLYGQLRLYAYGQVKGALLNDITPETVDVNSWVYATRANVVEGDARAALGTGSIVYAFPEAFLANQLGIAYSNGSAEVFHR